MPIRERPEVIELASLPGRSRTFFGWKVVVVAFLIALFGWGLGLYGLGVYLVVLNERHGWPIAFISLAITVPSSCRWSIRRSTSTES